MAYQVIPGAVAVITVPGHAGQKFSVALNVGKNLIPVPAYGSVWETYIGGLKSASGQLTFYVGKGVTGTNPFADANGSMIILFDTGCSFTMNVITGNVQIAGSVDGVNVATIAFAKSDDAEPTIAWTNT